MNRTHKIPVGISACLLGKPVRHNGGHKLSEYCRDTLGHWFDYRPVCPEMAAGLGTPRPAIRLVQTDGEDRAVQTDSGRDLTDSLAAVADDYYHREAGICGFIFMEKSPSCGVWRVKRYNTAGNPLEANGRGAFAARLLQRHPLLPVEEAGRLNDPDLKESFILRVFAYHDWQQQMHTPNPSALVKFWTRYKYLVLAHDEAIYRQLGPLVGRCGKENIVGLSNTFFSQLMAALAKPSTVAGNINSLEHLRGFVKEQADRVEKASLTRSINDYRKGIVPLIVPLSLLRHLLDRYPVGYARDQQFLQPYPDELSLRNYK